MKTAQIRRCDPGADPMRKNSKKNASIHKINFDMWDFFLTFVTRKEQEYEQS